MRWTWGKIQASVHFSQFARYHLRKYLAANFLGWPPSSSVIFWPFTWRFCHPLSFGLPPRHFVILRHLSVYPQPPKMMTSFMNSPLVKRRIKSNSARALIPFYAFMFSLFFEVFCHRPAPPPKRQPVLFRLSISIHHNRKSHKAFSVCNLFSYAFVWASVPFSSPFNFCNAKTALYS